MVRLPAADLQGRGNEKMLSAYAVNITLIPMVIFACYFAQPNIERKKLTSFIFLQFACHSVVGATFIRTDYEYVTFFFGMVTTLWLIFAIGKSSSNSKWSINVMCVLWASIVFNFIGAVMWLLYLPPMAYNTAMLTLNIATVLVIMLNGASIGRYDVMGNPYRIRGLLYSSWLDSD